MVMTSTFNQVMILTGKAVCEKVHKKTE